MSSKRGGGSGPSEYSKGKGGSGPSESSKGKVVSQVSDRWADQLVYGLADMSLESEQDGGGWEEVARKPKNRPVGNAGNQNPSAKVLGNPWTGTKGPSGASTGTKQPDNSWTGEASANALTSPAVDGRKPVLRVNPWNQQDAVRPPLEHGWQWRSDMSQVANVSATHHPATDHKEEECYDDIASEEDNDDDVYDSDEYDSDESQKSHETLKKSTLLKGFFDELDKLKVDEINEPEREWHCPACFGGPGAIDWYRGLQPLMTHAKTKGKRRAKVHRLLAQLLDEELRRRGTSANPVGEAFGKWKGLTENVARDKEIVWPPMVIIRNTQLEKKEDEKWRGMGNAELMEYFQSYEAVRARHSYGPQGHRGISVLIFEASAVGYLEAERLSKHFEDEGTNREVWECRQRPLFLPGGQRQLYGYLAEKRDLDVFNQHSHGKYKLKYEMRSYQEMVVSQMKQMSEDNHLLNFYKNNFAKERKHTKAVLETVGALSEKLRKTLEENRIVRQRTKSHHEQNKEEMDYQEEFFKEQIELIHKARDDKEENFEKIQQEKRERMKQYMENPCSAEDRDVRMEKGATLILSQMKDMDKFAEERDKLLNNFEEKKAELTKKHRDEDVKLEKEFNRELVRLMEKYNNV